MAKPEGVKCMVEACPGDGNYLPPGRGHICTVDEYLNAIGGVLERIVIRKGPRDED